LTASSGSSMTPMRHARRRRDPLTALAESVGVFLGFESSLNPADRPALRRGQDVPQAAPAGLPGIHAYLPCFKSAPDERASSAPGMARGASAASNSRAPSASDRSMSRHRRTAASGQSS
jgi:hypothetical protein